MVSARSAGGGMETWLDLSVTAGAKELPTLLERERLASCFASEASPWEGSTVVRRLAAALAGLLDWVAPMVGKALLSCLLTRAARAAGSERFPPSVFIQSGGVRALREGAVRRLCGSTPIHLGHVPLGEVETRAFLLCPLGRPRAGLGLTTAAGSFAFGSFAFSLSELADSGEVKDLVVFSHAGVLPTSGALSE